MGVHIYLHMHLNIHVCVYIYLHTPTSSRKNSIQTALVYKTKKFAELKKRCACKLTGFILDKIVPDNRSAVTACLTIIKRIHQLAGVDLCSPDQDVVQRPLRPVGARNHDAVADGERLPPAQAGCVGQSVFREEDVVVPD